MSEQKKGSITYFEPNELFGEDNEPVKLEELNKFVNLYVKVPSRYNNETSTFNSVLGGTEYFKYKKEDETKETIIPLLTDNYVDVSYTELKNGKINFGELFGIESIDINFDIQFFPRVTINFVDVRGFGLMGMELSNRTSTDNVYSRDLTAKSFFTSLFNFPYPTFVLEVKGYYGTNVSFDLSLESFDTSFDSTTGNFRTTVSFIGAMYGILGDIPMSYIMIAPYLFSENVGETNSLWNVDDFPTYLEYLKKYNDIISANDGEDGENKKNDSNHLDRLKKLKNLTDKLTELKNVKSYYDTISGNCYENRDGVNGQTINEDLRYKPTYKNDIFYVVKKTTTETCKHIGIVMPSYNEFEKFVKSSQSLDEWYIESEDATSKILIEILPQLKNSFLPVSFNPNSLLYTWNVEDEANKYCLYRFIDFSNKYTKLEEAIKKINNDISNIGDVNHSLKEYIGGKLSFSPTIESLYKILSKHLNCFHNIFMSKINSAQNINKDAGLTQYVKNTFITDIPDSKLEEGIPFFPMIAQKQSDGSIEIIYPGNHDELATKFKNRPEIEFTEEIYKKTRNFISDVENARTQLEDIESYKHVYGLTNKFNLFGDLNTDVDPNERNYKVAFNKPMDNKKRAELISKIFSSRLVTYSRMYDKVDKDYSFAKTEAELLQAAAPLVFEDSSNELWRELSSISDDMIKSEYNSFNENKEVGFINYNLGDEDRIDSLDSKKVHRNTDENSTNNNGNSTFFVLAEGTNTQIENINNRFKDNSRFYVDLAVSSLTNNIKNCDNSLIVLTKTPDIGETHSDGFNIYTSCKPSKDCLYVNSCETFNDCDKNIFENKKNAYFSIGDYIVAMESDDNEYMGRKHVEYDWVCEANKPKTYRNKILLISELQVLAIGEAYYLNEITTKYTYGGREYDTTKGILIPITKDGGYTFLKIYDFDNQDRFFYNFCLEKYLKILKNEESFNPQKKYIIAKCYQYDNDDWGEADITNQWHEFKIKIKELYGIGGDTIDKTQIIENSKTRERNELKTNIYYTLKLLYDKWFSGLENGLFNDFHDKISYYDTLYRPIGKKLFFDIKKFSSQIMSFTLGGEASPDVLTFMAQTAQANNCNFITLPFHQEFDSTEDFKSVFKANLEYNSINKSSTSYIVMHNSDVSHHLAIEDSEFTNDGLDIANYKGVVNQDVVNSILRESSMVAFGVTYGMQNQNFFRSIDVNTKTPTLTDYAIANTLQIANSAGKLGSLNTTINAQSLYPVYANRSYECTVEMMGCMNIRPLMYFQLNNVPMFRGAYVITNVSHKITPSDFSTTFTGTRVSKYNIPIPDEILVYSDILNMFDSRSEEDKKKNNNDNNKTNTKKNNTETYTSTKLPPVTNMDTTKDYVNLDPKGVYFLGYTYQKDKGYCLTKSDCDNSARSTMKNILNSEEHKRMYKTKNINPCGNDGGNPSRAICLTREVPGGSGQIGSVYYCKTEEKLSLKDKFRKTTNLIKEHLIAGYPIRVSVNHTFGTGRNEGTSDHYVVIYAYGIVEGNYSKFSIPEKYQTGKIEYYRFYESGTKHQKIGVNARNVFFYVDDEEPLFYCPSDWKNRRLDVANVFPYPDNIVSNSLGFKLKHISGETYKEGVSIKVPRDRYKTYKI